MSEQEKKKKRSNAPHPFDYNRISDDITALRTAINMQASLLSDIEKTLNIQPKKPVI